MILNRCIKRNLYLIHKLYDCWIVAHGFDEYKFESAEDAQSKYDEILDLDAPLSKVWQ